VSLEATAWRARGVDAHGAGHGGEVPGGLEAGVGLDHPVSPRRAIVVDVETATQTLHRLTSYASFDPDHVWDPPVDDPRVLRDLEVNDMSRFPWFFKRYEQPLPRIALPRQLPSTTAPAVAVLTGNAVVPPAELDLAQLGRLLHLSAGVVRRAKRPQGMFLFRAAGSAGGRFPLELYLALPEGQGRAAGVHWYDPAEHALVQIGPPPPGDVPVMIVTGIPWRTGWRYRERGYRHTYWDAGTMLAQTMAAADSAGLSARLWTRFPDAAVAELVGADRVHEWPVAVVALGEGEPELHTSGVAAQGRVDTAPREFPLVTAAQRAGEGQQLGRAWPRGEPVDSTDGHSRTVEDVVLARGSKRRMVPNGGLPEHVLQTSMAAAMRGVTLPHYVVVHAVEGITSGLYRWPQLTEPVRPGLMRDELYRVCLQQGLGRDAAFVVIGATHVDDLDDHEYREVHLAAGLVEGRLHLLAHALGASASGMTFVDALIPAMLGEPRDGVLLTCVGVPEYPTAVGGAPGAPTLIRMVAPRMDDQ
jgi:Nitroreductase family